MSGKRRTPGSGRSTRRCGENKPGRDLARRAHRISQAASGLVLSINAINDLRPDVLLVPLTTKEGPLRVELSEDSVTGLQEKTFTSCESVGPVHKSRWKRRTGRVLANDLDEVGQGVKRVLGL